MEKILKVKNDYQFSTYHQGDTGILEDDTIMFNNQKEENGFKKTVSKVED